MEAELTKLGLSINEAKTYLELLKNKEVTTTFLAKKLDLHRGYIYDVLNKLIEKGFVSVIKKNGKKHFEAVPPANIIGYIEEQKNKLESYEKDFKKTLPQLEELRKFNKKEQNVMLLDGKEALRNVLENMLIKKQEILVFGATGKFSKEMENYYFNWNKRRVKNKINLKIIYNSKDIAKLENSPEETLYVEKKILEFDKENPASTMITSDKVALVIWIDKPIITLIESKEVAQLYKRYFEEMWKIAKK